MTQLERIRLLIIFIIVSSVLLMAQCEASGDISYKLNLLPKSWHHGSTNATNERHKGVGLSMTLPNGFTYGAMHYTNSFGDDGWMASISREYKPIFGVFYPGIGAGYAPAYTESGHKPAIAWVMLRYRWITMMSAPGEVTTFMFSIPLE